MITDYLYFEGLTPPPRSRRPALVGGRMMSAEAVDPEAEQFVAEVMRRGGLAAKCYRMRALVRRVPACLRLMRVRSVAEARRRLDANPRLAEEARTVLLLGVTEFFRDPVVFDALEREVLPALWARQARPRIWSAACSEGHELYSVAMLLAEQGREAGELLGSDYRSEAIQRAAAGIFEAETAARLPEARRSRFFRAAGRGVEIAPELRSAVRWRTADLFARIEPGPWHLILWRNMAIYLDPPAAEELWAGLCGQLAPGGFLVAGKADHPPGWLPLRRVARCIFRKL